MHSAQPHREPQPGQAGQLDPRRPLATGNQGQGPGNNIPGNRGQDLCLPIQADLSAMLDGELDPAGVRRVTMHSDACPSCRSFFDGIRKQVGLHRRFAAVMSEPEADEAHGQELDPVARDNQTLRRQLTGNQRKLSRILYELGRNFTLMGLSPEFSREVAKEPMPVPDMAMRGRSLLDEVARASFEGNTSEATAPEWVAAKDLFDGQLRTPEENLARGQRLLAECMSLDPAADDARIYLGLVHYARGQRSLARKQFQVVLDRSEDAVMRGFALSNLSNIHLDEGDCDGAIALLLEVIESGVVAHQPRLVAALFNLALAHGLKGSFEESLHWFDRLRSDAPHRRRWVAQELSRRSHFLHLVHTHPEAHTLADRLREWFPSELAGAPRQASLRESSPKKQG
ncbi:MAG: tetratricopeptide (TPR) repeat protein [Planctomycetota bacterium]|jgi:tetratricopeptide (TPR) repeat protein